MRPSNKQILAAFTNEGFHVIDWRGDPNVRGLRAIDAVRAILDAPQSQVDREERFELSEAQRIAINAAISISSDIEHESHDGSFLSAESVQALSDLLIAPQPQGEKAASDLEYKLNEFASIQRWFGANGYEGQNAKYQIEQSNRLRAEIMAATAGEKK